MREADRLKNALVSSVSHELKTPLASITAAVTDLSSEDVTHDREQIREHLSGNYCRCTGYQAIVDAVETTARGRAGRQP